MTKSLHFACAMLFASFSLAGSAQTQPVWPAKPVRMIVGYPSGSSPDMQARLLAEPLGKALGQPVVIENKPGASGNIGAELLARAQDGHTIAVIGNGPLTSSQFLYPKLAYDPAADFAPVALIASSPLVLTVPKALGQDSAAKFIQHARVQGDKLAYGSTGAGAGTHLGMELLKQAIGIRPLHVPFAGAPAIINAMLGGQIHAALLPPSTVMPLVESGKLVALAVTSAQRSPLAPGLPAMEELGAKGLNIEVWNAVMAPSSMPPAHRARLGAEVDKILGSREVRHKLLLQGWKVNDTGAPALARRIEADRAVYRDVITRHGIKLD